MPGAEGKRWTVKRAVLGSEEVPVLAGDPALKSAQTEVGHIPVCRGAGTCPPCPAHSCCPVETGAVAGGVPGVGAQCWRRAGKDSVML